MLIWEQLVLLVLVEKNKGVTRGNLGGTQVRAWQIRGTIVGAKRFSRRAKGFATIVNLLGQYGNTLPPHEHKVVF
jgi:hypothetical protein